jgi:hypothetical protein
METKASPPSWPHFCHQVATSPGPGTGRALFFERVLLDAIEIDHHRSNMVGMNKAPEPKKQKSTGPPTTTVLQYIR